VNLDANRRPAAPAANKDAASGRCVIERVAREIAQNPVEQQRLTHDHGTRRQRAEFDPFAPRWSVELLRKAVKNTLDPNRLRHNLAEVPADT
jgi:FAD/FMN-containing dehydrogenase